MGWEGTVLRGGEEGREVRASVGGLVVSGGGDADDADDAVKVVRRSELSYCDTPLLQYAVLFEVLSIHPADHPSSSYIYSCSR